MGNGSSPISNDSNDFGRLYQDLVETSQDLIWHCDAEGRYTYLNQAWETVLGFSVEEMLGKGFYEFLDPATATHDRDEFSRLPEGGMAKGYEAIHRTKNGKAIHLSFKAKSVRDDNGQIIGVRGTARDITYSKRTEEAAGEARRQLQAILQASPNPVYLKDLNSRIIVCNEATARVIGKPVEAILGKCDIEYLGDTSVGSTMMANDRLVMESGTTFSLEEQVSGPNGDRYFISTKSPFRDSNGNIVGIFGISHDITDRKLVERLLRDSEKKYATAFRDAPVLISMTDLATGIYREVNDEALRVSGFSREEVIGNTAVGIGWITNEQRVLLHDEIQRNGRIDGMEMACRCKDGSSIIGIVKGEIVPIGGRDCFLTVTLDITAKKLAEEALRRSEVMFRTLFMSISEGFYLSAIIRDDAGSLCDYRFLEVNPAFEKIIGLQRDRIIGKRYRELTPVDFTDWLENYGRVAATGVSRTYDFYSPEYEKYFETFAYKTTENQIAVFVRDVTERKATESALQNVQKLESLGVLAGGIAHDFNNLLGGIFGYIDLALIEAGNDRAKRHLSKAMDAIDRARGLTHQLLTFAKGGAPVKKMDQLFPFVFDMAKFALSGSRVSCTCTVTDDVWPCNFDRNQIGQVVDNIVINAQQAMPGGGNVAISAQNVSIGEGDHVSLAPGCYVKISIGDQGIGMPPEIVPRIFDPFYTTKPKGHGLGLATCYSIVNRHDGSIDVESEPGKGSVFHVYLKANPDAATSSGLVEHVQHDGHGTILIMDDEEVIRGALSELLMSFGYSVQTAGSGSEAITLLAAEKGAQRDIVCMIFDLTVPGDKGGREIIGDTIRLYPHVPVFVASGYADDPVMSRPREFGFTASICKPFRRSDLGEMLEKYLNAGGATGNLL